MAILTSFPAALVVAAVLAVSAVASAPPGPYRTDVQAQHYLEHGLKHWAGIDLNAASSYTSAFCFNGFYSKTEQRTGVHFDGGQAKVNKYGEDMFRSFACMLASRGRFFNLYLVTLAKAPFWKVAADR